MNLKETISLLYRSISDLQNLKLPASNQQLGLMTPDDKKITDSLGKNRTRLVGEVDVDELDPGFYSGGNLLKGVPEIVALDGYNEWIIDVTRVFNGDKEIVATQVATGSTWKKVFVVNEMGTMYYPRTWQKITTETLLWSGSAVLSIGSKLMLIDKLSNYDALIVNYDFNGTSGSSRLQASRPNLTGVPSLLYFAGMNLANQLSSTSITVEWFEAFLKKADDSTLILDSFNHIVNNFANGSTVYNDGSGSFVITGVIGVR